MTSTPLSVMRPKRAFLAAPLLAAIALLYACGGGGGNGTGAGDPGATGTTLTGVVAVGAPLAGATVQAWCSGGELGASSTTDAGGRFEAILAKTCASPWLLQAIDGNGNRLHGSTFADVPDSGLDLSQVRPQIASVNITPLTDMLMQSALRDYDFGDIQAVARRLGHEVNWQEIHDRMRDTLALINSWRPSTMDAVTLATILRLPFRPEPGDPMDDLLEAIGAQRGTVTTQALLEQLDVRGGDLAGGQPWKTVFGAATTLTLSATACVSSGVPVDPSTVTLRMQDKDLEVTLASSRFAAPVTFTVGPAARSDFQMILDGGSPLVRLSASAGDNALDLFTLEGVPMIAFLAAGAGVSCTLSNPVRRADLVAFHPATRIRSVVPASGASGNCAASAAGAAYGYAVSPLGDVRFDGTSIPANWLDAEHAYYSESLQYGMGGPGPSYQVQLAALPTGQGIQGYYFSTVPYGINCTQFNP
jgi:hypothetical protein